MLPPPVRFESFTFLATLFYTSFGVQAYGDVQDGTGTDSKSSWRYRMRRLLYQVTFFVNIVNMNFVMVSEAIFVALSFMSNDNFIEATRNLCYIGFVSVGDIKIFGILLQYSRLTVVMRQLYALYPHTAQEQSTYNVPKHLRAYNRIGTAFALVHIVTVWGYNLLPLVNYLLVEKLLQLHVVEQTLPYFCWVPFDWHGHWSYYVMYVSQNLAGQTCLAGQLGSDLLLVAITAQLIMHLQQLGKSIESYVAQMQRSENEVLGKCADDDFIFLRNAIAYHQRILNLSATVNDIFGISLLINFSSSAFVLCFIGFQITVGVSTDALIMLFLFLVCSLIQIYMICSYGQNMIVASENIGHAVFYHDWFYADLRYKKMLALIIQRSKKPVELKATVFMRVSMGTITDIIQLSYKFFALIRTMYAKPK